MVKINAFFETFLDDELNSKLQSRSNIIRVYCMIKFRKIKGFTDPYPAIIDTGAHTSVIPLKIWRESEHKILVQHYIKGVVPNARMDVKVGEVSAALVDLSSVSKEYKFLSYFSPSDNTPLILGFKELLSKFKLTVDYSENLVWLEEK